ncbi:hypothetical protein IJJ08_03220 [bacterium]|nr:hypothetical protein [bacterium]
MALEKLSSSLDLSRYVKKQTDTLVPAVVAAQEKNRYVSTPEQLRALQLCRELDDPEHKIYYLSLCKRLKPEIIDAAVSFVSDAQARSKAKLFMWQVKQLTRRYRAQGLNPNREDLPAKKTRKRITTGQQQSLF